MHEGPRLRSTSSPRPLVVGALSATLAASLLVGCGTVGAPGRPPSHRPEASFASTPGTPRGHGTPMRATTGRRALLRPRGRGGKATGRTTPARRTARPSVPPHLGTGPAGGLGRAVMALFDWGMGRPPGGIGAGLRDLGGGSGRPAATRPGTGTSTPGKGSARRPRRPTVADRPARTRTLPRPGATQGAAASPYADGDVRRALGRLDGAHRVAMGIERPPVGSVRGPSVATAAAPVPLPTWRALWQRNDHLVLYAQRTPWVAGMGVHWGPGGPGLVLMQNGNRAVTAVETTFPAKEGWQPWYDQPDGRPAGSVYTEHLYFIAPASITTTMAPTKASDLSTWAAFGAVNTAKTAHDRALGPDPSGRATQYGPPSFGIRVLVDRADRVVGLVGLWTAHDRQAWHPWFDQARDRPIEDPLLGSVYSQHLWLVDPRSLRAS